MQKRLFKHKEFLDQILKPFNIKSRFYVPLQFIFRMPALQKNERFFDREKSTVIHTHVWKQSQISTTSEFSSHSQINHITNYLQKKVTHFSVIKPVKTISIIAKIGMGLLIINKAQHKPVIKHLTSRITQPVRIITISKPEIYMGSYKDSAAKPIHNLVVSGSIKQQSDLSKQRGPENNNDKTVFPISRASSKQNFTRTFLKNNILYRTNDISKSYYNHVQSLLKNETKHQIRFYQYPIDGHKYANLTQGRRDLNKTELEQKYRYSGPNLLSDNQQQSTPSNSLAGLIHRAKQVQKQSIDIAKKQISLQASPDLIHPRPAVTPTLHKEMNDNREHVSAFSLPIPKGIVDPVDMNSYTGLSELTDKVMQQIEHRIKTEQERRGIFV